MIWFIKRNLLNHVEMATVVFDLNPSVEELAARFSVPGYRVKRIERVDPALESRLEEAFLRLDINKTFTVQDAKNRLDAGHLFFVLEHSQKIIGWNWVGVGDVYFDEFFCRINIGEKCGFLYNAYVDPGYRGKKLNQFLLSEMAKAAHCLGFLKLWALIYYRNKPSLKSFTSFGFKDIGSYKYTKLPFFSINKPPRGLF